MSLFVVARYVAGAGEAGRVRERLIDLARMSRREAGNLEYRVAQDTEDPQRFVIVERYVDAEAFAAHRASEHFTGIAVSHIIPLLAERDVRVIDEVSDA